MKKAAATQQSSMNQQKFEELFSKYREVVYRTAYSATGNKQDALDIQQDIFLRLVDQGNTLDSISNPESYLCRMALNEARQKFRTRKRWGTIRMTTWNCSKIRPAIAAQARRTCRKDCLERWHNSIRRTTKC